MKRKDIKIQINTILWEMAQKKIEADFRKKYTKTDCLLIIMLLALYKRKSRLRTSDSLYLAIEQPDQLAPSAYKVLTIAVYDGLLDMLQELHPEFTYMMFITQCIDKAMIESSICFSSHLPHLIRYFLVHCPLKWYSI